MPSKSRKQKVIISVGLPAHGALTPPAPALPPAPAPGPPPNQWSKGSVPSSMRLAPAQSSVVFLQLKPGVRSAPQVPRMGVSPEQHLHALPLSPSRDLKEYIVTGQHGNNYFFQHREDLAVSKPAPPPTSKPKTPPTSTPDSGDRPSTLLASWQTAATAVDALDAYCWATYNDPETMKWFCVDWPTVRRLSASNKFFEALCKKMPRTVLIAYDRLAEEKTRWSDRHLIAHPAIESTRLKALCKRLGIDGTVESIMVAAEKANGERYFVQ
ncbi:hypothetical protein DFH09DRAFT_375313 [Mycena vulgaris]|nr:hypothetical protein DFH09DRAFT_375313 [Mycena vulgaris]